MHREVLEETTKNVGMGLMDREQQGRRILFFFISHTLKIRPVYHFNIKLKTTSQKKKNA